MAQQNLDLYYPQILDKHGKLLPIKVSDALRRAYDMLYQINPPAGSDTPSVLRGLTGDNISDVPADRISSGTVNVGVEIVLSAASVAHPNPAQLIWENTGIAVASQASNVLFIVPPVDATNFLLLGSDTLPYLQRWKEIRLKTNAAAGSAITLHVIDDLGGDSFYELRSTTGASSNHIWNSGGTDVMELSVNALFPSTTAARDLGSVTNKWRDLYLSNPLGVAYGGTGLATAPTNGKLLIGNGTTYTLATLTGTANQVIVTNGAGSITLSLPQSIGTASNVTFNNITCGGTLSAPTISAPGSSAITVTTVTAGNISLISAGDIVFTPTGNVKFGTHSALGAEALSGYITIKDAGGTSRKIAVIS